MSFLRLHCRLVFFSAIALSVGGLQIYFGRTPLPAAQAVEEVPAPQGVPADSNALDTSNFAYVGTASCAASNCHGGGRRELNVGEDLYSPQAYSRWIHQDPHAKAYSTLFNDVSQNIARKLSAFNAADNTAEYVPAHKMDVCLNCHTINPPEEQLTHPVRHTLSDGVGCEACHGPASQWNALHSRPGWSTKSPKEKEEFGFRDLENLSARGKVCIDCHIGGVGRDVNHDLIAAGHPRLNFELSSYHASMPKHWHHEDAENGELDKVETRLLLVGQTLSAIAALRQLDRRATLSQTDEAPWPEFAEYDCYACHHELSANSWRQQKNKLQGKAGEYPWGAWYFAMLPELTKRSGQPDLNLSDNIDQISQAMSVPYPKAKGVIAAVQGMMDPLHKHLAETQKPLPSVEELQATIVRLTGEEQLARGGSREIEAQRFLAITSLYHSLMAKQKISQGDPLPEPLDRFKAELDGIRSAIVFTGETDTEKYVSPHDYDSERQVDITERFGRIHQLFKGQ